MIVRMLRRARRLRHTAWALLLAVRDPRTPWPARVIAGAVVAYAFSPIDLIPDVIPLLGLLDDLVLIPIGIAIAIRLIPELVWTEAQARAAVGVGRATRFGLIGLAIVVVLWLSLVGGIGWWVWREWLA